MRDHDAHPPQPLNWDRFDIAPVLLVVIPGGLLLASLLISVLTGTTSSGWSPGLLITVSVVAFALQCTWIRRATLSMPARGLIFVAQFAVTAALIWASPFFGIYAFMGYMTALMMFSGVALWTAMSANAVLAAVSQIGGFPQIPQAWPAMIVLVGINTGLVVLFSWVGARRDREVAEREAAVTALEEAQQRNTVLQEQLLERARERGVLEERARLSREIHDTVAQDLVAIVSQLEAIDGDSDWVGRVETAKTLARSGLGEARRAVYALRSPMLDSQPLPLALSELVNAWATVHHLRARIDIDGDPVPTDDDQNLLRICQEALSNVSRHAHATSVDVSLSYVEEGVLLDIKDDGHGFDPVGLHEGNGLRGMRERVSSSGGTVDISATPGAGCLVSAVVPA
ncbi:sensor histidine kinase [Williamsia maris]|uniref:Signal transduction histidine kinase n=1 Tax=Williamsia maris TaxID=72806 RepID=A0ABT1HCA0_9NOCA|nr:sensor histidine kinase [Williamsia maris]MCP2175819.1 Signal transduction histidine kinase [Williamsia maris]